jgi:hypothetical protein
MGFNIQNYIYEWGFIAALGGTKEYNATKAIRMN